MIPDYWTNCYDLNWKNLITPAAFSHPAKFSHGLIKRIYDHALQDGLIQPGGVVLDPFGGVGLGALYAMQNGLHWVGVELEPKFVELARENIALWNARYAAHFPNWGTARVYQGDSRRLAEVVSAAGLVVSSPPYANQEVPDWAKKGSLANNKEYDQGRPSEARIYGQTNGQLGAMPPGDISAVISSPPFAGNTGGRGEASRNGIDAALFDRHSGGMKKGTGDDPANLDHLPQGSIGAVIGSPPYVGGGHHNDQTGAWGGAVGTGQPTGKDKGAAGYGQENGQIGQMKEGTPPCSSAPLLPCIVSSPPFADSVGSDDPDKRGGLFRDEKRRNDTNLTGTYGETEGQLGAMKAGAAVISSPPFENQNACNDPKYQTGRTTNGGPLYGDYGSTDGQIAAAQGQTFWEAARLIVEQCALLLPVGGAAIWVVKGYIKNGKYVDFPGQWQQLCEACGFETVHIHRAMLVKEHAAQKFMLGGLWITNKVERKSFFRRLAEKKGSPPIDFETVLCMRKAA